MGLFSRILAKIALSAVVVGSALSAAPLHAATYDLTLSTLSAVLGRGTVSVPDTLLGPAHANAFIPIGQITGLNVRVNSTTFTVPGDQILPDYGLWLDANGQPLGFGHAPPIVAAFYILDLATGHDGNRPQLQLGNGKWRYHNSWDALENASGTFSFAPAPKPPRLLFAGKNVAGTSNTTVVVGQPIKLAVEFTPPTTPQIQRWLIPDAIGGYAVSPTCPKPRPDPVPVIPTPECKGEVIPLGPGQGSPPLIKYYWPMPGLYKVVYRYALRDGVTRSVDAIFKVVAPQVGSKRRFFTSNRNLSIIRPANNDRILCGDAALTFCIRFFVDKSAKPPASYNGKFLWVQRLEYASGHYEQIAGAAKHDCSAPQFALDTNYPYSNNPRFSNDSPSWLLTKGASLFPPGANLTVSVAEGFEMHLLWKSDIPGAIEVPLASARWSWRANTDRISGHWLLRSSAVPEVMFQKSHAYPVWQTLVQSGEIPPCK